MGMYKYAKLCINIQSKKRATYTHIYYYLIIFNDYFTIIKGIYRTDANTEKRYYIINKRKK